MVDGSSATAVYWTHEAQPFSTLAVGDDRMTATHAIPGIVRRLMRTSVVAGLLLAAVGCGVQAVDDQPSGPTTIVSASTTAPASTTGPTSTVDRTTTSTSTSTSTTLTTTTSPQSAILWSEGAPAAGDYRTLLDQTSELFARPATCRPIRDQEVDELEIYPQGPDEASIECTYPGRAIIVFSLFSSDAAMTRFFEGRLAGRDLAHGAGRIGSSPGWELDYSGDPSRGSGSIFGTQRSGEGARSEIGFIRNDTRTYAYSYALGDDFAAYYRWWASVFGGPAPLA